MDDATKHFKTQRNEEPKSVDVTTTGTHPSGNYLGPEPTRLDQIDTEIWIEQDDHAKQGMARKFDMKSAQAAPDHPHIGHVPGSGESQ